MLSRATPRIFNAYRSLRPCISLLEPNIYSWHRLAREQQQKSHLRFYQPNPASGGGRKREEPESAMGISVIRRKGRDGGYCYGCGADLRVGTGVAGVQVEVTERKGGYWAEKKNILRKSQIKNWALCTRCRKLKDSQEGKSNMIALAPNSRMTEVFRREVSKIRELRNVVVVLCIDAINCTGSMMRTIRNYVGGNPILLAITRCDLLPDYISNQMTNEQLKDYFYTRTKDISPAGIYLCSESPDHMKKYEGIKNLAADLWQYLDGRDTYIVGSANIGKSTLTDILINGFLNRGERLNQFRDRIAVKRLAKLREARVTKSALPGTTLQNIRVPCFIDHEQALWDTPGLLLDESLQHFPIKDFHRLRAMRPSTVEPLELTVPEKSFAVLLYEEGDEQELPLLRLEVRLKKNDPNGKEGPVKMIWNSTLKVFKLDVVGIDEANERERERLLEARNLELERRQKGQEENQHDTPDELEQRKLTPEERKLRKEERKREYKERVRREQEEMGMEQWKKEKQQKDEEVYQRRRLQTLAKLSETGKLILDGNVGMDVDIAHLGWFGILSPRATMIKAFAPNTGVRVSCHPSLALPKQWGSFEKPNHDVDEEEDEHKVPTQNHDFNFEPDAKDDGDYLGPDLDDDLDLDDDYRYDDEMPFDDDDMFDDAYPPVEEDRKGPTFRYVRGSKSPFDSHDVQDDTEKDPWAKYSGHNVGWKFDDDLRFAKNKKLKEGWNPIPKHEKEPPEDKRYA